MTIVYWRRRSNLRQKNMTSSPFEDLAGLDKLIHEPARLAILTALSSARKVEFLFLQSLTGLTKGNLSAHLSKLEDATLVVIHKQFEGKKPITYVELSAKGRDAIDAHWQRLDALHKQSRNWQGE